ncbi:MAG: transcription-repair coupling factor [Clostridiales bacterium]|nr:transcription-repair coupling factor [Clostridiales bacterium]
MVSIWRAPMLKWTEYKDIETSFKQNVKNIEIVGLSDSQKAHIISNIIYEDKRKGLFITYSEAQARQIYKDLRLFIGDRVVHLPEKEISYYNIKARSKDIESGRLKALNKLVTDKSCLVVASIEAILFYITPPKIYNKYMFSLELGDIVDLDKLLEKLIFMGYEKVVEVEGAGQFSHRGGILDIFPLTNDSPYRVELFDVEVDSIREFDPISQLSTNRVKDIVISPCSEIIVLPEVLPDIIRQMEKDLETHLSKVDVLNQVARMNIEDRIKQEIEKLENNILDKAQLETFYSYIYSDKATILDYIDGAVIFDEPLRIRERYDTWLLEFSEKFKDNLENGQVLPRQSEIFSEYGHLLGRTEDFNRIILKGLPRTDEDIKPDVLYNISARTLPSYQGKMDMLFEDIASWKERGYSIIIFIGNRSKGEVIQRAMQDRGIEMVIFAEDDRTWVVPGQIVGIQSDISRGFEYIDGKLVVISHREIHGFSSKKRAIRREKRQKIDPFTDLKTGDYVVHESHGIGRYLGIEKLTIDGKLRDYLNIQYAGSDTLYVSTDQMETIQPYIATGGGKPRLYKLGGTEWQKTRNRARESAKKLAYSLVELYAARENSKGFSFSKGTDWEEEFAAAFPYQETEDQLQAIEEISRDMESERVMDRLLCGDVGYGKTEVAMRAAFKAVMDEKQVAVLAPTTILAQQHYSTFIERFKDFPFRVEVISRFKTTAQQSAIIKELRRGNIDIIIGTHRLLSKDIKFKDLGLLIVDEEQRFGVDHKELIKNIKKDVDVLTLTATPIPRTLHMSLVGIRDISIIETPPEGRYPVETYVIEYNPSTIREVIDREIARGGQVYFVYNRVKTIDWMAGKLTNLLPDAKVAVAHGQMGERRLEKIMLDFYNGHYDILLCSTIIESGLDVPNVNTVIVYDSDNFGLSQLYQLRGRVGRSDRRAYAYLTYQKDKVLSEIAEKRLRAIKEFTEFGAGFKIAMRDLEIRGTGNLLGPEQHGHLAAVGYDLYCKLLDEAISDIRGMTKEKTLDPTIDLGVDAYIDDSYISHEAHKIEFYKKIASIDNMEDRMDVADELIDRFGDIPKTTENLIDIAYIKGLCKSIGIEELFERGQDIYMKMAREVKLDPKTIMTVLNENRNTLNYKSYPISVFTLKVNTMLPNQTIQVVKKILERIFALQQE